MKTQHQIYYEEQRKIAALNQAFLCMVEDGLTRKELATLIERRPEKYERFENWLEKLP